MLSFELKKHLVGQYGNYSRDFLELIGKVYDALDQFEKSDEGIKQENNQALEQEIAAELRMFIDENKNMFGTDDTLLLNKVCNKLCDYEKRGKISAPRPVLSRVYILNMAADEAIGITKIKENLKK